MGWLQDKLKVPLNYERGFKDGFIAGIHASKKALKLLNKHSEKAMKRYIAEDEEVEE